MAETPHLILKKEIPSQVVNEGASLRPLNLNDYIQLDTGDEPIEFYAELADGRALPSGLICTSDGLLSGIARNKTTGRYEIRVIAQSHLGEQLSVEFELLIKSKLEIESEDLSELKTRVWEALENNLPIPEFDELLNRPITAAEIYYLMQRFATFSIWDIYNLDYPGEKQLLTLPGASKHYNIYDRGCCIIGAPKDLFSHERTLEDALQTARVIAREVYKRGWVVEFAGFHKMAKAAWVELQILGAENDKYLEVLHYAPDPDAVNLFETEWKARQSGPAM